SRSAGRIRIDKGPLVRPIFRNSGNVGRDLDRGRSSVARRRLTVGAILAMVTAAGCGGGGGQTMGWVPTATTNDARTISGGMTGTCSGTAERKQVPVTLSAGA